MGRTDAGEGALSYNMYWFLDVRPSRVFEMFTSRGSYVCMCILYGWGCCGMPPCAF